LGQNVPHEDLLQVVKQHKPEILITSITSGSDLITMEDYLSKLSSDFSQNRLFISGMQLAGYSGPVPENVVLFRNAMALKDLL
jgi:methanogenic corrinoid protein MtbC1